MDSVSNFDKRVLFSTRFIYLRLPKNKELEYRNFRNMCKRALHGC